MSAVASIGVSHRVAEAAFVSCICKAAKSAAMQMQEIDENRLRSEVFR
jgi:hypothetical protein